MKPTGKYILALSLAAAAAVTVLPRVAGAATAHVEVSVRLVRATRLATLAAGTAAHAEGQGVRVRYEANEVVVDYE